MCLGSWVRIPHGVAESFFGANFIFFSFNNYCLTDIKIGSIFRHYFVKSTNTGEQFFLFTNLAVWLMKKIGEQDLEYPQEVAGIFDKNNLRPFAVRRPQCDDKQNSGRSEGAGHSCGLLNFRN